MDTGMLLFGVGGGLVLYIYIAICLMFIAQKTGTKYPWLAWIPIANVFLMAMIAKKPWWWALIIVLAYSVAVGMMSGSLSWLGYIFDIAALVFSDPDMDRHLPGPQQTRLVGYFIDNPDSQSYLHRDIGLF